MKLKTKIQIMGEGKPTVLYYIRIPKQLIDNEILKPNKTITIIIPEN